MFEKVRHGEIDEVVRMVQESNIDVTSVVDEAKNFNQTLIFTACVIRDPELSLKMIRMLVSLGLEPTKEDTLKQSPLFYASREGLTNVIDYLLTEGGN